MSYDITKNGITKVVQNGDISKNVPVRERHVLYFDQRIKELGLSSRGEALKHGLSEDPIGNILLKCRHFNGEDITYLDRSDTEEAKRTRAKHRALKNRKTFSDGADEGQFLKPYQITRLSPENLETNLRYNPRHGKYLQPSKKVTGLGPQPMPTITAIDAYNSEITGGGAVGIEGGFKAISLSLNGIEATAFTGISTYWIKGMEEYLIRRRLDYFVIMYDADALQLSTKQGEVIDPGRVMGFYFSPLRFAEQFHDFCKQHKLKTRLHFCMVNPGCGHKGVDDLLAAHTSEERAGIIEAWHTLTTSKYFEFIKLGKSTYKRNLDNFFGTHNHVHFYRRYRAEIGLKPFRFGGLIYQAKRPPRHYELTEYQQERITFHVLDDPFHIELEEQEITVERWLTEAGPKLDNILQTNTRLCLNAITGTGKTSFFLGHTKKGRRVPGWFHRANTFGVITVPTVLLAKQLERKYGIPCLSGYTTPKQREKAIGAPVIVCTYDTLRHVSDLYRRVLVVDECHNLVNQWGNTSTGYQFRADTLRNVVEVMDTAKQTVIISATPSKLFAKLNGFHYVKVNRRQNNTFHVYEIEAEKRSYESLTAATVARLENLNFKDGRIRFVHYNHTEELYTICRYLIDKGVLSEKQIEVISRPDIDAGNNQVFENIVRHEKIPDGVALILSTCIVAEGVNINNSNIGEVFEVGVNCEDSFFQFGNRFRKMDRVNVYSIRPPESNVDSNFTYPAEMEAAVLMAGAKAQIEVINSNHSKFMAEYTDHELEFWNDIPQYQYTSRILTEIYQPADSEEMRVDVLRICAAIRERKMSGMNNAYFYSQLAKHPNVVLEGKENAISTAAAEADLEEIAEALEQDKDVVLAAVYEQLASDPAAVITAYHQHAQETNNRHATARIQTMAADLVTDTATEAATTFRQTYGENFRHKWLVKFVSAFLRLYFIGADAQVKALELGDFTEQEFHQKWRLFTTYMEFLLYDNTKHRKLLSSRHKTEIKAKRLAVGWIEEAADGCRITSGDLVKLLNEKFTRYDLSPSLDGVQETPIKKWNKNTAERFLSSLFHIQEEQFSRHKEYTFKRSEIPPFTGESLPRIVEDPTRFLDVIK